MICDAAPHQTSKRFIDTLNAMGATLQTNRNINVGTANTVRSIFEQVKDQWLAVEENQHVWETLISSNMRIAQISTWVGDTHDRIIRQVLFM